MSGKELNKIVASILLASFIIMVVGFVANMLYKPNPQVAHRGYRIDVEGVVSTQINQPPEEEVINIAELMKTANSEHGKEVAKKCLMCHSFDKDGMSKIGPHLSGIVGRAKASIADYKYSRALSTLTGVWDETSLFDFLHKPSKYVPGTKMSFVGITKPQDIADVILFLKTYHDK
jgi:cytochrome c